jgi:predicted metalloprotease with PDZ domain
LKRFASIYREKTSIFGFKLRGRRPLVVDSVDPSSPVQLANIYPGDVILSVNGINVENTSHRGLIDILKSSGPITVLEVSSGLSLVVLAMAEQTKFFLQGYSKKRIQ